MAIINFKNISTFGFDEDVLTTNSSGDRIINFGSLTTTGDLADGIYAGASNVSISNFGPIETFGLGARGVYVLGNDARVENHGSIVAHGEPDFDTFDTADGIVAIGDRFYIANYGFIQTDGLFSSAMFGFGNGGTLVNFGSVTSSTSGGAVIIGDGGDHAQALNYGQIAASGEFAFALFAGGDGALAINRGEILLTGDSDRGVRAEGDGSQAINEGKIISSNNFIHSISAFGNNAVAANSGEILVTGDGADGIFLDGDPKAQATNTGKIIASGENTHGVDVFGDGASAFNSGKISMTGDGSIGISTWISLYPDIGFDHGDIVNSGEIQTKGDGAPGVLMVGDGNHLSNSGLIVTNGGAFGADVGVTLHAAGVLVSGDGAVIDNKQSGVIESKNSASAAVELNVLQRAGVTDAATSSLLWNDGLIKGASVAVLGGAGQETIVNHGDIVGDVVLGDGNDTFVFGKHGSVLGNLFLGGGDDLVYIEKNSGSMSIADFAAGSGGGDVIDISAFYSNFADLKAHAHQMGTDTVIALGHNDQLVLADVKLSALDAGDFQFKSTLGAYLTSSPT